MAEGKAKARSTIAVDGTWDIETENWDTFVCGALYVPGEGTKIFSWREEEAFVDELISRKRTLWGHNAGRFDSLWLLGHLVRRQIPCKLTVAGAAITSIEVDGAVFRDSARLIPMSLEKASQIGSERKASTELPCSCPKKCGGYCSISRSMSPALYKRLVDYMVQDCRALYSALDTICTLAERYDLDLRPTIGASAWKTVQRSGIEPADWGDGKNVTQAYKEMRRAYFGGRTQVFKPKSKAGTHWDINSAYPAALANLALPVGERTVVEDEEASRAYASGRAGAFRAVVHVPECFLPPLPVRTKQRIAYPVGLIGGWWTALELQAAQSRGATIRRITKGMVYDDVALVLEPFCRKIWGLRDESGKKTALGNFWKLYVNSLTGKLATKEEVESITMEPARPVFCPGPDCGLESRGGFCGLVTCCKHVCTGRCGKCEPIAFGLPFFSVKYPRLSDCSHIEWAAYLTAYTRVEVLRFAGEGDDAVYCDTDSLFCEQPRTERIGNKLGEWKLEDSYSDFYSLAPKTYAYTDQDGEKHAAAKGIPDAVNSVPILADGGSVLNDRGVNTFKSAVKNGTLFQRRRLERSIKSDGIHFGDRVLRQDGRTYPREAKQIREDQWELT